METFPAPRHGLLAGRSIYPAHVHTFAFRDDTSLLDYRLFQRQIRSACPPADAATPPGQYVSVTGMEDWADAVFLPAPRARCRCAFLTKIVLLM